MHRYETQSGPRWRALGFRDKKRFALGSHRTEEAAVEALKAFYGLTDELTADAPLPRGSLGEWAQEWIARRKSDGLHRATGDGEATIRTLILPHAIGRMQLGAITTRVVKEWLREQRMRTSRRGGRPRRMTVVGYLAVLRGILRDAVEEELIATNPALGVKVPKEATTQESWTTLTLDEVRRVLAAPCLCDENRNMLRVAVFTGLRLGEICGLRWRDVDLANRIVTVRHSYDAPTKAGKVRQLPLISEAAEALADQRTRVGSHELVFPAVRTNGMRRKGDNAALKPALRDAGITRRVRFHDLRHTCASLLISGALGRAFTLNEVQFMLGHASQQMTSRYAHLAPDSVINVVRTLDFKLSKTG